MTLAPAVAPPGVALALTQDASGVPGQPGQGNQGGEHANGNPGGSSSPGGGIKLSFDAVAAQEPISLTSNGGAGGRGADAGGSATWSNGGDGTAGGAGGSIDLTVSGAASASGEVVVLHADGGAGGVGGNPGNRGRTGTPGLGGGGGRLGFVQAPGSTIVSTAPGIAAVSVSGSGGAGPGGGGANTIWDSAVGPAGARGGDGGNADVTISGTVRSAGTGVSVLSQGGFGGNGGEAGGPGSAVGGAGGGGGRGGTVTVTLNGAGAGITGQGAAAEATGATIPFSGSTSGQISDPAAGVLSRSEGAAGGQGGLANGAVTNGGAGGAAGGGGQVTLDSNGASVSMTGYGAVGLLAQSVGGAAGSGSAAGAFFRARGGIGGAGGDGGEVRLQAQDNAARQAAVITNGDFSDGMVGQSLGGGGGHGGSVRVGGVLTAISIGGNGGAGGQGGPVTVRNGLIGDPMTAPVAGATISTHGANAAAILAQSVAGGGGRGGDAYSVDFGALGLTIGGAGGAGGQGGTVRAENAGIVQARGHYAYGVAAQSIAGGGGMGGAASTVNAGTQIAASVALGGSGGAGGTAGTASIGNSGQVATGGDHAYGLLAQSIAGGGGAGGSSSNRSFQVSDADLPSVNLNLSLGGSGGAGGTAALAVVSNLGGVITTGTSAHGLVAQSIAGGGGIGGSAGSAAQALNSPTISVTRTLGGAGGAGGTAGGAAATNSGLVYTLGRSAAGILAQSIAGGGGAGGSSVADTGAYRDGEYKGLQFTLSSGGVGGTGGRAEGVLVANTGGISTRGDNAPAILAQSIAGGGGAGGDATANGSGNRFGINIGLGGSGGSGNVGGSVTVTNGGAILTQGGGSAGIHAQSIGGGGGTGGAGAAGGGTDPETAAFDFIARGMGISNDVVSWSDGIYSLKGDLWGDLNVYEKLRAMADAYNAQNVVPEPSPAGGPNLDFTLTVGGGRSGSGGAGHDGGTVTVTNTGTIVTDGPQSTAILAQSIGGGGGTAGAAAPRSGSINVSRDVSLVNTVGGSNGRGGNGGSVTVNSPGTIQTAGDLAFGIHAQSIGGGGGVAVQSILENGRYGTPAIRLGGSGGATGNGGDVTVTLDPAAANNHVSTTGRDAVGIVAQSVGGGGGASYVMAVRDGLLGDPSRTGQLSVAIPVTLNASGGNIGNGSLVAEGNGGTVTVRLAPTSANYGYLQTSGVDAHGVLAQSIGGGGGWVAGANNIANPLQTLAGTNGVVFGNGGPVRVSLDNRFNIGTYGAGAAGILAQSIGGGGGLFGGLHNVLITSGPQATPQPSLGGRRGQGGDVTVLLTDAAGLATRGDRAHGIVAQSLGGGGGIVDQPDGRGFVFAGGQRYAGCGHGKDGDCTGRVSITVDRGSLAEALGTNAVGVFAQSRGNGVNDASVTVGDGSVIRAQGTNGTAVWIDGADSSTVTVQQRGTIEATNGALVAIESPGNVTIQNAGTIRGAVFVGGGGASTFNNQPTGTLIPVGIVALGTNGNLNNAGTIDLTQGASSSFLITGHLNNTGRIVTVTDHATGQASRLDVQGSVTLAGTVEVRPTVVANRAVTVLTASEGVNLDAGLSTTRTHLFAFDARQTGNSLQVRPRAEFTQAAGGLGANQQRVAAHLQDLWNSGASLDAGFTALAGVRDGEGYGRSLNSLSGQTVGAISAFRFSSSRGFVSNMFSECPSFEGAGVTETEASCGWSRVFGSHADQGGTGGALGYQTSAWTLQTGGQRQVAPNWFLGGSIAYESSVFRGDAGNSKVSGDSVLVGATLRYQDGPWQVAGALDFGYGWYDSQRTVEAGSFRATAKASPDAWHVGAHSRLAYTVPFRGTPGASLEGWYVQPRLDLHLNHVRGGGYTERGAGPFNLTVDGEGATTFTATPAVEVGARLRLAEGAVLRPFASAGVELIANGDWAATARFAGQSGSRGFRATTPIPDVLGKFSVGADLLSSTNWDLRVQYTAEVGSGFAAHTGVGRLAYRF